ncbi:MAG: monooxygenase [Chloroflexi bacterium]|nr:MAG: monooxygenase [Chloroflexota bacterium]MBL1196504.1 monooxygenase [Chloroflexota bacterium]NOH13799.1 NAD(P)-binding domain-containing protein [Chloroflexota bacterium]
MHDQDVIIVGAGPAGIGMGLVLQKLGIERFTILERDEVGSTFKRWPKEMRFITPSFTSNAFGLPDLNAVDPSTSPGFTLRIEHPSGEEYAEYLQRVVKHFDASVEERVEVEAVQVEQDGFLLETSDGQMRSQFLIWATGEFQYPYTTPFAGAELCRHSSTISSWTEIEEDDTLIIGGYESGIDGAVNLAQDGRNVRVIDIANRWQMSHPDPSIGISPYTLRRLEAVFHEERIELIQARVTEVKANGEGYEVLGSEGESWHSEAAPILATGFGGGVNQIRELFEWHEGGYPIVSEEADESTDTPGLFLVGPQVRHGNAILCFIYKFRQRFAVVGREIGQRMGLDTEVLEEYRLKQMYLDDLTCCEDNCTVC